MTLAVVFIGVSRFPLILGIEPQGNAHSIKGHLDLVGMDFNICDHGAQERAQPFRREVLPGAFELRSIIQKPLPLRR
jgi:hypothetical protein